MKVIAHHITFADPNRHKTSLHLGRALPTFLTVPEWEPSLSAVPFDEHRPLQLVEPLFDCKWWLDKQHHFVQHFILKSPHSFISI